MNSTAIDIPNEDKTVLNQKRKISLRSYVSSLMGNTCKHDMRKVIHSIKVGIALVLVSLLYFLDPLFKQVGENAMWAIMTVVVVFEFFAGATLSKGLNRAVGTILGGGLGCLAAILADEFGRIGNAVIVGTSVFIFGCLEEYFSIVGENENQPSANVNSCKSVLHAKSTEESLLFTIIISNFVISLDFEFRNSFWAKSDKANT